MASSTASISGVVSGIKTDEIIAKMMDLAKAPVTRMQTQQTNIQTRINVWQELNTRLLAFKSKSDALSQFTTFRTMNASSSDTGLLAVTAGSSAEPGSYSMKVNATAKTNQLKMQGFADTTTTTVGTGMLAIGVGSAPKIAISPLTGSVDSVTLAADSALATGSQSLVIDAAATTATHELSGTYAGADEAAARTADAGAAGIITINGKTITLDDSATLGSVVDAINLKTTDTGVRASITGSADNWHVTLTQQSRGSLKQIAYGEDGAILNGGAAGDFTAAGSDALGHIGAVVFDKGSGDTLQSAAGDVVVLNNSVIAGTVDNAFDVLKGVAITIDSTNNTLAGLRNAINASNSGVTASILNDGAAGSPYRLVVTSKTSGTAGAITLDSSRLTGGTTPAFTTLQAAQDASITLGEGAGAITVTKGSNTVTDMIQGVTLYLKASDTNKTLTVDVTQDTATAKAAVVDFVTQYNNLVDYITPQSIYDAAAHTTGALFGDSTLRNLLSDMRSKMGNPITGIDQDIKVMSQIGIKSTTGDKLQIDDAALDEALNTKMDQVQNLFAKQGSASDINVTFSGSTIKTATSSTAGYAVNITQAATQGYVVAGAKQTSVLAQNETLSINGTAIALTTGMTQSQVVTKINSYNAQTAVTASIVDGALKLRSDRFGDRTHIGVISNVSALQNQGANSGFGNKPVTDTNFGGQIGGGTGTQGLNVAGTINGEAATGSGQFLTGNADNAKTSGLMIKFTGAGTGSFGTVGFTRGLGGILADFATSVTTATTGSIARATTSLQDQITHIGDDITAMNNRLAAQEARLTAQFNAMEAAMSTLKAQGDRLSAQLAQSSASSSSK